MNHTGKIALSSITGIGIGILLAYALRSREDECSCSCPAEFRKSPDQTTIENNTPVTRMQGNDNKHFPVNPPSPVSDPITHTGQNADLKRWGTRQGLIEVASFEKKRIATPEDDLNTWGTRQGIMEVGGKGKTTKASASSLSELERWGTTQGIIDVSLGNTTEKTNMSALQDAGNLQSLLQMDKAPLNHPDKSPLPDHADDRATWGTKQGIIDVSREKAPVKQKVTHPHSTASFEADLERWGTRQGLMEVNREPAAKKRRKGLPNIQDDHKRWGTRQGIIEVSNDQDRTQKRKKKASAISQTGFFLSQKLQAGHKPMAFATNDLSEWYRWLIRHYEKTQVSITNTSAEEKTVVLWGASSQLLGSAPSADEVEALTVTQEAFVPVSSGNTVHPQGIVVNPANGLVYVANQLSNNVSVLDTKGNLVALVSLEPNALPGLNSPVALAVNTNEASSNYGKVYVVGSVANTVSVIDLNHAVTNEIQVGYRPLAIAFNPQNGNLYVANFLDDGVSIIDTELEQLLENRYTGSQPLGIGIHPPSGKIYVANSGDNTITVLDPDFLFLSDIITDVGVKPVSFAYHPENNLMYVVATDSNHVIPIEPDSYTLQAPIATGFRPYGIVYNPNNQYLYVGNSKDDTYTIIAPDHSIRAVIQAGPVNIGLAIDPIRNLVFSTDTATGKINIIGYKGQSTHIRFDPDYEQKNRHFQHIPALIKHVKMVLSGSDRPRLLTILERTAFGKQERKTVSLESHQHPQNFLNVSELFAMDGTLLNGMNTWMFTIAAGQTITLLLYYQQLKSHALIPH